MIRRGAAALAAALCILASKGSGQSLALIEHPPLAPGIEALPRVAGTNAAIQRMNARLDQLDAAALADAKACNTTPPESDFSRWIEMPFTGPDFLAFVVHFDVFCTGAAHPQQARIPLVFDAATGLETDLRDMFPGTLLPPVPEPGPASHFLFSAQLNDIYLALYRDMPETCHGPVADNKGWFQIWPDAAAGGLVLWPAGLSHAEQACAEAVILTVARMRSLGFDDALTQALNAAMSGHAASLPENDK